MLQLHTSKYRLLFLWLLRTLCLASRPSAEDLERALLPRPLESSHVHGATPREAFAAMNRALAAYDVPTAPCDEMTHQQLDGLARLLYGARSTVLDRQYRERRDRRALHFENITAKEKLWRAEGQATIARAHYPDATAMYNATRDGKCAEVVMWWVHHLTSETRTQLSSVADITLPLMPRDLAPANMRSHEYEQQIGCTSCHTPVHSNKACR